MGEKSGEETDMNHRFPAALLACIMLCTAGGLYARMSDEEKHDLYSSAKEFFRKANEAAADDPEKAEDLYRQSVMRFERLADEGDIHSGKLYYNIGNGYFRMQDLGRAILNYRRAQHYMPSNPLLLQNLEYARSRCRDRIDVKQKTKILKTVLFWHYDLSMRVRSLVFWACYMLFWTGSAVRLFFRKAVPVWMLVCAACIALLFLGSVAAESVYSEQSIPGVILSDEVTARKGDGINFEPAFKKPLHEGTEFILIEKRSEWLRVELPDGRRCWVPRDAAGLARPG